MNRLVCVTAIALALAAFGSGCCCMDRYYHGDCPRPGLFGMGGGPGGCGTACGGYVDDGCADGHCGGPVVQHGGGCNDCGTPACGDCGGCNLCCFNPFKAIFGAIHCSSGCGEFYYDEWLNDPPDACDPCDNHGGFIGQHACPPRWFLGRRNHCGYQCAKTCDTCCGFEPNVHGGAGCTSCGHDHGHHHHPGAVHDTMMPSEPVPTPEPDMMSKSGRPTQPYYPARATQRTVVTKAKTQPTPAARRVSYETTAPTTTKAPIGTGVRRR